jgi:DNA segregation ATPase FtsK/SpoIIIE and related proteins
MNWLAVLLPPAVMVGVAIFSMILTSGSLTTLLFIVPMTLITLVTSIITYFSQKKKYREKANKQRTAFDFYKKEVQEEINRHYTIQQFVANNANPNTFDCLGICENRERRLWNRLINDYDFLDVKLGMGSLPLASEIKVPKATIGEEDELLKEVEQIKQQYSVVKDIAITFPLKTACTVGFIGHKDMINKVAANALVQLATHHSYTDLRIVLITNKNDIQQWAWLRWLPHIWESSHSIRNIAVDDTQAGNLLEHFESILADRVDKVKNNEDEIIISPYYLFVITDPKIVDGSKLIKLLSQNNPAISAGTFYLFGSAGLLPKECNYFVKVDTTDDLRDALTDAHAEYIKNDLATAKNFES